MNLFSGKRVDLPPGSDRLSLELANGIVLAGVMLLTPPRRAFRQHALAERLTVVQYDQR